jgi:hypothetical protein
LAQEKSSGRPGTQRICTSGTVFNDADNNDKHDTNEAGLSGWTVDAILNNTIVEQATTPVWCLW